MVSFGLILIIHSVFYYFAVKHFVEYSENIPSERETIFFSVYVAIIPIIGSLSYLVYSFVKQGGFKPKFDKI